MGVEGDDDSKERYENFRAFQSQFPPYSLNPCLDSMTPEGMPPYSGRKKYELLPLLNRYTTKTYKEDMEAYRTYYSSTTACCPDLSRQLLACNRYRLTVLVVVCIIFMLTFMQRHNTAEKLYANDNDSLKGEMPGTGDAPVPMPSMGSKLECPTELLKPSDVPPKDVNHVRPADIKVIGAIGDSLTVGAFSKNYVHERNDRVVHSQYPGNSWATGVEWPLHQHTTLANILRQFNPSLIGGSTGEGYGPNMGFNKAVGGMTSDDLHRQATALVKDMTQAGVVSEWKLITLFIGTNDVGRLNAYKMDRETVLGPSYRSKVHAAVGVLKESLPNTLVAVMPMWNSQICIDSTSLLATGKRATTNEIPNVLEQRDALIQEYKKAAFDLPAAFDSTNFTVIIAPFLEDYKDAVRNKKNEYDFGFYADDTFHLSKYGNAVVAKWFWNSLMEPVGKKSTLVDLTDTSSSLKCPDKDVPYIRTIGNSPQ